MNWPLFWIISSTIVALLLLVSLVWTQFKRRWPGLAGLGPHLALAIIFWTFWGGVFGALGAALLMRAAGIVPPEATRWIIFGTVAGSCWGAVWGLIFSLTER
jgi:hypothetical protein